jgi:phenylacetate-CoA ligase|uniref:Phenylacetate--CoA ligase family protein n=1 Tax=Desulfomonile tiedjei TaxID=2358 RepID=A0A7C4EWC6_9BACT
MIAWLKSLVRDSSFPFKDILHSAYNALPPSIAYGKVYRDMLRLFQESESWDRRTYEDHQNSRLSQLIKHAYDNVPYYREVFDEHGLAPRDIQTVSDLKKLPLLTSDTIKSRWDDFAAKNVSQFQREMSHTSGSTGPALYFYFDKTTIPVERAQAMRHLLWLGYKAGDKIAVIKGQPLQTTEKMFKYLRGAKELRVSLAEPTEENLRQIAEALAQYRPAFIRGWPSSIYTIARWISENRRQIPRPKYIVTSSENLYPYMKKRIEESFDAPVADAYGQSEFVAYALQCAYRKAYHVQMETSIVEFIPYRGNLCEIVGTCLWNTAMPFIRYKTGDLAIKGGEPCPCGRQSDTIAEVIGRTSDIVFRDETSGAISPISSCSFYDSEEIKEAQILIEDDGAVRVRIAPRNSPLGALHIRIKEEIAKCLDVPYEKIIVEEVQAIQPAESGKKALVVGRSPSL